MNTKKTIYLDYASSHPRKEEVMMVRQEFERVSYANIGRGDYHLAEASMVAYQNSKKSVARLIWCDPGEVIYTYSATYALNILALALEQNSVIGRGDTILLSVSEHHANIVPWQMMAERVGAHIRFVALDSEHRIDMVDLKNKLDASVKVVSLQYASNVTGAVHPLEQVRAIIGPERLFCVDATQMILHSPLSMRDIQCDALVFSGHKMMADTGIWVLALCKVFQKAWQAPIGWWGAINQVSQEGYEQAWIPERWEPGTQHITGAITIGAAIACIEKITPEVRAHYRQCIDFIDRSFASLQWKWLQIFHSPRADSIGVWSFIIPDRHPNDIVDIFAEKEICLRSGHHCCEPLHDFLWVAGTVRISIGFDTTQDEIEQFFEILRSIL